MSIFVEEQESLQQSAFLAVDIGGTLIKLAYAIPSFTDNNSIPYQIMITRNDNQFLSNKKSTQQSKKSIQNICIKFVKLLTYQQFQIFLQNHFIEKFKKIKIVVSGGGAFKYKNELEKLSSSNKVKIETSSNQWEAIVKALTIMQKHLQIKIEMKNALSSSLFSQIAYSQQQSNTKQQNKNVKIQLPFIVANIGSGVSFLKIYQENNETKFQRIGGTSLGGGYFGGLAKLIEGEQFSYQNLQNQLVNKALQTCVANLLQIMILYCKTHNAKNGLFLGSFCQIKNVKQIVKERIIKNGVKDVSIYFSDLNGYLGVFGLITTLIENNCLK